MVCPAGTANSGKRIVDGMQLEVAALGDLHGACEHAGRIGKEALHLVGALDEELVGVEAEAFGVVDL